MTQSSSGGYSTGYIKYASNGADKIYFCPPKPTPATTTTTSGPATSPTANPTTWLGNVIDANMFDNEDTAGVGAVPDITEFTQMCSAADT